MYSSPATPGATGRSLPSSTSIRVSPAARPIGTAAAVVQPSGGTPVPHVDEGLGRPVIVDDLRAGKRRTDLVHQLAAQRLTGQHHRPQRRPAALPSRSRAATTDGTP